MTYQTDTIGFGGRIDADKYEIGFVDGLVDVHAKVQIATATLFNYLL